MTRTTTPEMAAAATEARNANQRKARGKATKPASEAPAAQAEAPKRQPVPEGQQRSRGRLILKARTSKDDAVIACNFGTCANPARWPVGHMPDLAAHPEVKAGTVTCTTHLRTILRARNMLERQADFETLMLGGTPKPQPKRRRLRKPTKPSASATA